MTRIWNILKAAWGVLYDAALGFSRDHGTHFSAAMAFYAIFAVAPFILIATAIGGLVYGRATARAEVVAQITKTVGPEASEFIVRMLENWRDPSSGIVATAIGVTTTLYLAFRVFDALRDTLNILWNVQLAPDISWGATFRKWGKSFLMMFLVGPLLLASIVLTEVFTRLGPVIRRATGWGFDLDLGGVTSFVVAFAILTAMFSALYKWLPDVHIAWRDVLFGAAVTALLFSVGRSLIGLYMARASTASLFGAAGSLVVLLFWIYYSAQILFLGAEITEVFAKRYGRGIAPGRDAVERRPGHGPASRPAGGGPDEQGWRAAWSTAEPETGPDAEAEGE